MVFYRKKNGKEKDPPDSDQTKFTGDLPKSKGNLSDRETDVLLLIKDGLKNPEIAEKLGLSIKTVENHVRSILLKLGSKNRTEAVVVAVKHELIDI